MPSCNEHPGLELDSEVGRAAPAEKLFMNVEEMHLSLGHYITRKSPLLTKPRVPDLHMYPNAQKNVIERAIRGLSVLSPGDD